MVAKMEVQRDTQSKNRTEVAKSSNKRKRESASGISKNEEEKTPSKILKTNKSNDSPRASRNQDEMLPEIEEWESSKPNSDNQLFLHSERKCCKKKCIHVVNLEVREKLNQAYKEQLNHSREHGRSYLRKYIYPYNWEKNSKGINRNTIRLFRIPPRVPFVEGDKKEKICQKAFMKIFELRQDWAPWLTFPEYDYIQIKLEMKEELPLNNDDVCEKGKPAKETETMSMTQNDFNSATDGVQMIPKVKEEPVEYNWVDVKPEPTLETHCRCISSAPIHFNSESEENLDQFKKMTNWSLYGIHDDTLEVLFNEGYNSVLTLESIDIELDLQEIFGDDESSQISTLRHFVESLNCRKHPPIYPGSGEPVVNKISYQGGSSLHIGNVQNCRDAYVTSTSSEAVAAIGLPPYNTQGEDASSQSESAESAVDLSDAQPIPYTAPLYMPSITNSLSLSPQMMPGLSPRTAHGFALSTLPTTEPLWAAEQLLNLGRTSNSGETDQNQVHLRHVVNNISFQGEPSLHIWNVQNSSNANVTSLPSSQSEATIGRKTKFLPPSNTQGAELFNKRDLDNKLLQACQVGSITEVTECLRQGADVNCCSEANWNKQTALHRASKSGHDKVCQVLLQAGSDVHATDILKQTALHSASTLGRDKVCQVLLQAGSDVHATDILKKTALRFASALIGHDKVCQVLLQAGADVHAAEINKQTALHLASKEGLDKVCQVLLQAGADVQATDGHKQTALHLASKSGRDKVCQLLLQAGAEVHATDNDKQTALHYASRSGHDKVCQLLLQAGADVQATDTDGKKPIDVIGDCALWPVSADKKSRTRQVLQAAMDKKSRAEMID